MTSSITMLEALEIIREPGDKSDSFRLFLACGFTPLNLATFLKAQVRRRLVPPRMVESGSGIYGNLIDSLERLQVGDWHAVAVAVEWSDLDPRLGFRSLGGWRDEVLDDIVITVRLGLGRLQQAVLRVADTISVSCSMPSLCLPPVSYQRPNQAGSFEWSLHQAIAECAAELSAHPRIRIVNPEKLDHLAPMKSRYDARSDLAIGSPYSLGFSSTLAGMLAELVVPTLPKKGLITDLDDTLWSGILGEMTADDVTWDLEHGTQVHGLYQQLLTSLASAGILIAVASKNDPQVVDTVLGSGRLLINRECLYPVEVNWGPKSVSVANILRTWNIGGDAVVFVDDSAMELAEVKRSHPAVECLLFPKNDPAAVVDLLWQLRERFAKDSISDEDRIRARSIRVATSRPIVADLASEDFLDSLEAIITMDPACPPRHGRALELINKTNQFNLNGRRYTELEWATQCQQPGRFAVTVNYEDKFGPLGRIALVSGRKRDNVAEIDCWVLSCRAFSRLVEHSTLRYLFDKLCVTEAALEFRATERNGPMREFLESLRPGATGSCFVLDAKDFSVAYPRLPHSVREVCHE